jgi:hypothetical protein
MGREWERAREDFGKGSKARRRLAFPVTLGSIRLFFVRRSILIFFAAWNISSNATVAQFPFYNVYNVYKVYNAKRRRIKFITEKFSQNTRAFLV